MKLTTHQTEQIEKIEAIVCRNFNLTPQEIHQKSRKSEFVIARNMTIHLAAEVFRIGNMSSICNNYFDLTHGTAIWGMRLVQDLLFSDKGMIKIYPVLIAECCAELGLDAADYFEYAISHQIINKTGIIYISGVVAAIIEGGKLIHNTVHNFPERQILQVENYVKDVTIV